MKHLFIFLIICLLLSACEHGNSKKDTELSQESQADIQKTPPILHDTAFVNLAEYAESFAYNMKYATEDNFLKKVVYDCSDCLIRKEVADALIQANDSLNTYGYSIQFFDCYRPIDVQKQMWEIYPDARYVANPNTTGSIHNRGGAVDITLVDASGNELDMGTGFDHFGEEAHHSYQDLNEEVIQNRRLLKGIMMHFGFDPIKTEWWHYNFRSSNNYALSNFKVKCD